MSRALTLMSPLVLVRTSIGTMILRTRTSFYEPSLNLLARPIIPTYKGTARGSMREPSGSFAPVEGTRGCNYPRCSAQTELVASKSSGTMASLPSAGGETPQRSV
jgi:hypothetical protein